MSLIGPMWLWPLSYWPKINRVLLLNKGYHPMKFECSGSKGTRFIERKRSVTDGQTDRRTDGRTDARSHRWTFVRYFGTQQVPIGMPGRTDGRTDRRTRQKQYVSPRGGDIIQLILQPSNYNNYLTDYACFNDYGLKHFIFKSTKELLNHSATTRPQKNSTK